MKIGTKLSVEVFEPVLDEEGDVKNMVMYMVAEAIGDIPLEVKWWTVAELILTTNLSAN